MAPRPEMPACIRALALNDKQQYSEAVDLARQYIQGAQITIQSLILLSRELAIAILGFPNPTPYERDEAWRAILWAREHADPTDHGLIQLLQAPFEILSAYCLD